MTCVPLTLGLTPGNKNKESLQYKKEYKHLPPFVDRYLVNTMETG